MLIICIEGSRRSSSVNYRPLTCTVCDTLLSENDGYLSLKPFGIKRKLKGIVEEFKHTDNVLIVAKSLGAYKLYKYFNMDMLYTFNKIAIVTVDPHASFWRCGPNHPIDIDKTPFGIKYKTTFTSTLQTAEIKAWNIYQRNEYPQGGYVYGAKNIKIENTNHFEIISAKPAINAYKKAAEWLGRP